MADADPRLENLPRQCAVVVRPELLAGPAGRPALAGLMREVLPWGFDDLLLLTRAGEAAPLDDLAAALPRSVRIRVSEAPAHVGTGGALARACDMLQRRFVLVRGTAFPDPFGPALAAFCLDGNRVDARLVGRNVADRRGLLSARLLGGRVAGLSRETGPGLADGGVTLMERYAVDGAEDDSSFERGILPMLASRGSLRATVADTWVEASGPRKPRPALLLGWRGVLRAKSGAGPEVWARGAEAAVRRAKTDGWHVFAVSRDLGDAQARMQARALLADGGAIDDVGPDPAALLEAWGADAGRSLLLHAAGAGGPPGPILRRVFHGGDLDALVTELLREGAAAEKTAAA